MLGAPVLRALSHRNFRLYFVGQAVSLIGTWTQSTAVPWLVARMTESPWLMGQVGFFSQLPCFFLAPYAGYVVEHSNRHRLLLITQTLAMIQAFLLAALVLTGAIRVWHIIVLNASLNAINAFDMTIRQTFLRDMLGRREDLANAIGLNSTLVNGSRLIGPALAAWLIATLDIGVCFLVNALSFLAVLISILAMRVPPSSHIGVKRLGVWQGLTEGVAFAIRTPPIRAALLLVGLTSLVGLPYATLVPFYATEVLKGDATTYGWLMTAPAVGAFCAGLLMSAIGLKSLVLRTAISPILAGGFLMGFSLGPSLPISLGLLFGSGFSFLTLLNSCNTLIQTIVPDSKRARMMSLYTMMFLGVAPIGSAFVGYLADPAHLKILGAIRVCGLICLAGGVVYSIRAPSWLERLKRMLDRNLPATNEQILPVMAVGPDNEPVPDAIERRAKSPPSTTR